MAKVVVAQSKYLAAPEHGEDADGHDPRDVLRHPRLELLHLVPREEARLALVGARDADAVDRAVDLLAAILRGLQDPLEEGEGHLGATRRMARDVGEEVLDERAADALDREVVERREVAEAVLRDAVGSQTGRSGSGGVGRDQPFLGNRWGTPCRSGCGQVREVSRRASSIGRTYSPRLRSVRRSPC